MTTINDLYKQAKEWESKQFDVNVTSDNVSFGGPGSVIEDGIFFNQQSLLGDTMPMPMTVHAGKQMSKRLGLPAMARATGALMEDVPGAMGQLWNEVLHVKKYGSHDTMPKKHLVRCTDPIDGYYDDSCVRAVMGPRWTPLPITTFFSILNEYANVMQYNNILDAEAEQLSLHGENINRIEVGDGAPFKIERVHEFTPDRQSFLVTANMKVFIDGDDSGFSPGFGVSNSGISRVTFKILRAVLRLVCSNGMTSLVLADGQEQFSYIRHDQRLSQMETAIQGALTNLLPTSVKYIDDIARTATIRLRDPQYILSTMIDAIVPETQREAAYINLGMGDSINGDVNTALGVANRLTHIAHTSGLSAQNTELLETVGGTAVDMLSRMSRTDGLVREETVVDTFFKLANVKLEREEVEVE